MKTILVLAGNGREFETWIKEKARGKEKVEIKLARLEALIDDERFIYGVDAEKIRGLKLHQIVFVGTFGSRSDAEYMHNVAVEHLWPQ